MSRHMTRRRARRLKRTIGLAFLLLLAVASLCTLGVLANGSDPGKPLHDRVTPIPAPSQSPVARVDDGAAAREAHYLSHLKSRGMTNQATTTSDSDMVMIGHMICSDMIDNDRATYDTERPLVQEYTDGDPVYASMYLDAATSILCPGKVDK